MSYNPFGINPRPRTVYKLHCKHCNERIKRMVQFEPATTKYKLANSNAQQLGINPYKCAKNETGEHQP